MCFFYYEVLLIKNHEDADVNLKCCFLERVLVSTKHFYVNI